MRNDLKEKLPGTWERAKNGSRTAAIKLFCLECVGGQAQEVRDCTDKGCFLFPYRPFK